MKEISWFIQRIGVKIKGSHHNEPFVIENAAHASRLFKAQHSVGGEFDEEFSEVTAEVETTEEEQTEVTE